MRPYFRYAIYLAAVVCFSSSHADPAVDFFRAVNIDNERTVKSLLADGLDPNTPNPQGQVGLFLAMRDESPKVAAVLLAHPAVRVDATTPADETPLMMACLRGSTEWATKLLDRGAAINRKGWTPLHYAASGPQTALVTLLLDRGADIDAASPNRSTPLMMAARYGASESAELLLSRGADTKARNDRDLTAAAFARAAGREALAARIEAAAR